MTVSLVDKNPDGIVEEQTISVINDKYTCDWYNSKSVSTDCPVYKLI